MSLNESIIEEAALEWFGELGYSCLGAEALAPALSHGERESYSEVVRVRRLRETLTAQIKNRAHECQGTAISNFVRTLPDAKTDSPS